MEVTQARAHTSLGAVRASVSLTSPDGETCRLEVPKAVGRALAALDETPTSLAEAHDLIMTLEMRQARERVVSLVRARERSREDVRRRLLEEGYASEVVEAALEEACAARIVSDARFADAFVSSKLRAGWGRRRIERELATRGIDAAEVEWPEELDEEAEYERALELAGRHHVSGKDAVAKQTRYLVGRGYSTDVAYRAARQALSEE